MKLYYDYLRHGARKHSCLELPVSLGDNINLLIMVHVAAFAVFVALGGTRLIGSGYADQAIHDHVRNFVALSSGIGDFSHHWLTGLFTYQFVHFRMGEVLLSAAMLWLFGHVLQQRIGQTKVVIYYFVLTLLSAMVFNVAHLLFPVFANPGDILYGAFGGVLGVMTTAVFLYGKRELHIRKSFTIPLWAIYAVGIVWSLATVYKNNLAFILLYAFNIYAGVRYGIYLREASRAEQPAAAA